MQRAGGFGDGLALFQCRNDAWMNCHLMPTKIDTMPMRDKKSVARILALSSWSRTVAMSGSGAQSMSMLMAAVGRTDITRPLSRSEDFSTDCE